jgi:hypothetical protein
VTTVALAAVTVWAGAARALGFQSSYSFDSGAMVVTLKGDGSTQWNDLEIPIRPTDAAGSFSTGSPNWSVSGTVTISGRSYIRLTRSSTNNTDETITINGPGGRGGNGTIHLTLDNTVISSKSGQTYMTFSGDGPGLGPWGIALLVLLVIGAGSFLVLRSRTRTVAA